MNGANKADIGVVGGFIMKHDKIILCWSINFGTYQNAEYIEARAITEAILKCDQLQIHETELHTDSELVWSKFEHLNHTIKHVWYHLFHINVNILQFMNVTFVKSDKNM